MSRNLLIKSRFFSGVLSLGCELHLFSLVLFIPRGYTQTLEVVHVGKHPPPRLNEGKEKTHSSENSFRCGECSGCISPWLLFSTPGPSLEGIFSILHLENPVRLLNIKAHESVPCPQECTFQSFSFSRSSPSASRDSSTLQLQCFCQFMIPAALAP